MANHLRIAQISDVHCGHPKSDEGLMNCALDEIRHYNPDVVVVAGGLTSEGYAPEFRQAKRYLDRLKDFEMIVIPGTHDLKNVGFLHFPDAFGLGGTRHPAPVHDGPRRATGTVGDGGGRELVRARPQRRRRRVRALRVGAQVVRVAERLSHLRLAPPPRVGSGHRPRAQHRVGAGDVLALLDEVQVDLVFCGHKHVPNVWQLGEMLLISSGTATSHRVRGYTRPSYNVIEIDDTASRWSSGIRAWAR